MADEIDPRELSRDADRQRIVFLRHEIEMCNTFCDVAETEVRIGDRENAARSIADAQRGYDTATRFLTDPKHAVHIPEKQFREIAEGLNLLRQRIERFRL